MGGVSISIYPQISIHALREEGDFPAPQPDSRTRISIHALREEGDYMSICMITINMTFLSTPSARRATKAPLYFFCLKLRFLSTPSARRATSGYRGSEH